MFFSLSDFIKMSKPKKPALIIIYDNDKPRLEWLCVEKWQEKVNEMALVDLINKMPHIKLLPRFQKLKDKYKYKDIEKMSFFITVKIYSKIIFL